MRTDSIVASGDTFFVTDKEGRLSRHYDGFYHQDTRHLDRYNVDTRDTTLETLSIEAPLPGKRVIHSAGEETQGARPVYLHREQVVTEGLYERVELRNLTAEARTETLTIKIGSAFDDIFEIRGYSDPRFERTLSVEEQDSGVQFEYEAPDIDFSRTTAVAIDADVDITRNSNSEGTETTLSAQFELAPHETQVVWVSCTPDSSPRDVASAGTAAFQLVEKRFESWTDEVSIPETDTSTHESVLNQSVEDLLRLTIDTDHGPVPAAGLPWFATPFGRDSLIAAYQALSLTPKLAQGTLRYLAAHQATSHDEFRGAEPGKIMHEIRRGELAERGDVPHTPYYGTIDATALFVVLLHETWVETGDDTLVVDLWENLELALEWLHEYGDSDDDGFLEYPTDQGDDGGLTHQAWKDSNDGIVHPDESHPVGPLAVAEAQGYYYDAMRRAADLYREVSDDDVKGRELEQRAAELQERFDEAFWLPEEEFYAVALDGNNNPIPSVTSNPGHCLWSGLVPEDRADDVVDRLLTEDMFTGWGIRTNAASHESYNPISYHLGSVWPHDNSLLLLGFDRYGRRDAVEEIATSLLDAVSSIETHRLPELFAGLPRSENESPVPYGTACEPQAWSAGTPLVCLYCLEDEKQVTSAVADD